MALSVPKTGWILGWKIWEAKSFVQLFLDVERVRNWACSRKGARIIAISENPFGVTVLSKDFSPKEFVFPTVTTFLLMVHLHYEDPELQSGSNAHRPPLTAFFSKVFEATWYSCVY